MSSIKMFRKWLKHILTQPSRVSSISVSEAGSRRIDNQDSVFVCNEGGVFAVADGMGGGARGEVASDMVRRRLAAIDWRSLGFTSKVAAVTTALKMSNDDILSYAHANGLSSIGTTAAVLVIDTDDRTHASVTYVGDSRVYRIRDGIAEPLTLDHTLGRELGLYSNEGRNTNCSGRSMQLNHVLTRAIGIEQELELATIPVQLQRFDRFMVCSDGVHDVLDNNRIAMLASANTLNEAKEGICASVISGGSPDNYAFILVDLDART